MRLNLDVLQDYLPADYEINRFGPTDRSAAFSRPFLYENGDEMKEGSLYVARADLIHNLSLPKHIGLVCVGGNLPQTRFASNAQILSVSNATNALHVFNQIHEIYNRFDAWDERLRDELEEESDFDIRRMLLLGAEILENPVCVVGDTLQRIFQTVSESDSRGGTQLRINESPTAITMDYMERIKEVCQLERNITGPYLSGLFEPGQQSYCHNLFLHDRFMGCVSVTSLNHPFRESDFFLASHYFRHFQKAFFKYLRSANHPDSSAVSALYRLLSHEPLSAEEHALFELSSGEYWICIKLKEKYGVNSLPQEYLYGTLSTLINRNFYITLYHGEIVGLIRTHDKTEQSIKTLDEYLDRIGYIGGLSGRFTNIDAVTDYLQQASYAVELHSAATDKRKFTAIRYFEDYVLQYMLGECIGKLPAESLYPKGLPILIEYDRQKGTEYVKTLDVYLKNEMSIPRTSAALFIHRTSLLKRLDRIEQLMEDDLSDPDVRLHYRICFALHAER